MDDGEELSKQRKASMSVPSPGGAAHPGHRQAEKPLPRILTALQMSSGSSDLWVSDRVYDPDESTTWSSEGQPVNMTYGIGFMSGVYGLDRVCLATMPQRTC